MSMVRTLTGFLMNYSPRGEILQVVNTPTDPVQPQRQYVREISVYHYPQLNDVRINFDPKSEKSLRDLILVINPLFPKFSCFIRSETNNALTKMHYKFLKDLYEVVTKGVYKDFEIYKTVLRYNGLSTNKRVDVKSFGKEASFDIELTNILTARPDSPYETKSVGPRYLMDIMDVIIPPTTGDMSSM